MREGRRLLLPAELCEEENVLVAWASLVVSILAVVVAGVALYFHFPAEKRAKKAESREEAAEERARAAESREQARAQREEAAARAARMGRPSTDLLGTEPSLGRAYRFHVTNIGQGVMRDLKPMLIDSSGKVVSEPFPKTGLKRALLSGAEDEFTIKVKPSVARNPLFLRYEWTDDDGNRDYVSRVEVPGM